MIENSKNPGQISRLIAVGLGFLVGILNGLIAFGGGALITPILVFAGFSPQVAVGTSLAAVTMVSGIGLATHLLLGDVLFGLAQIITAVAGGVVGSILGSRILARLTPDWMLILFALIQILVAARLIDQVFEISLINEVVPGEAPLWVYLGLGLFAGTLSGIFGVGGGALVLLCLAVFYGVPIAEGLAIALALNVTNALAGLLHHARQGRVLWYELKTIMAAAILGIGAGALLAHELPLDIMRALFGGFFLLMGILMAQKGWAIAKKRKGDENAVV